MKAIRKDFNEVSEMLANLKTIAGEVTAEMMHYHVVSNLAYIFAKSNENFDEKKFKAACNVVHNTDGETAGEVECVQCGHTFSCDDPEAIFCSETCANDSF